jgi:hypothetical protein
MVIMVVGVLRLSWGDFVDAPTLDDSDGRGVFDGFDEAAHFFSL